MAHSTIEEVGRPVRMGKEQCAVVVSLLKLSVCVCMHCVVTMVRVGEGGKMEMSVSMPPKIWLPSKADEGTERGPARHRIIRGK